LIKNVDALRSVDLGANFWEFKQILTWIRTVMNFSKEFKFQLPYATHESLPHSKREFFPVVFEVLTAHEDFHLL
jgi:hypothetical protein